MAIQEMYRDEFEQWYAEQMKADQGGNVTAKDISKLRDKNGFYGGRGYLNGCWIGFCAGKNGIAEKIEVQQ